MATPKKFFKVLHLTPKTKKLVCVLCGNRTEVSDYRRKLFHGNQKSEYCLLIEQLLEVSITESFHTDTVCRKCLRELQKADSTIKKFKSSYISILEKLKESHGRESGSYKRQLNDDEETSRKVLFVPADISPVAAGMPNTDISPEAFVMPNTDISLVAMGMASLDISPEAVGMPNMNISPEAFGMPNTNILPEAFGMPNTDISPEAMGMPNRDISPEAMGMPSTDISPEAMGMPNRDISPEAMGMPRTDISPEAVDVPNTDISQETEVFLPPRVFSAIEVSINYSGFGKRTYCIKKDYEQIIVATVEGSTDTLCDAVMNTSDIREAVTHSVLLKLTGEIKSLCSKDSDSLLRNKNTDNFPNFSWIDISREWQDKAPLFHRFLDAVTANPSHERNKLKKGENLLPAIVSAGCKLLSIYSRDMNFVQNINSLMLLKGGCKKSAFTRLNTTNDCLSYQATLNLAEKVGNKWSDDIISWKETVENDIEIEERLLSEISDVKQTLDVVNQDPVTAVDTVLQLAELESQLETHRKTMHPGYYFVGDNVDLRTDVRHMTSTSQAKDQHMFQMCAYMNRVSWNLLDNSKPKGDINTVEFKTFIPSDHNMNEIYDQLAYIVALHWTRYIPCLRQYENVIPSMIEHAHMKETKTKTQRINLGVLQKNEQYNDDMTDIWSFLHQYVPGHDSSDSWQMKPHKIFSGGDYLTFERHKQAQASKRDGRTPTKRLEGLIPRMEEFHNECEFLAVIWKLLYSTASAKDTGTLYAARNAINARKMTKSPSDDFYASSDLFEKFTIAIIICGALHYFKMESLQSEPKVSAYSGGIGDQDSMKEYIMGHARAFVDAYAHIHLPKFPDYGPQSNDLKCRYCHKQYQCPKPLRKHEASVHEHADPLYNAVIENSSNLSEVQDNLLNYTQLSLALGLLRLNQMDAIKYGDGERIMSINKILYLFYKELGFPKYAYGMLETITQANVLLSERKAHQFIWNRTVNHRGDRDSNHPNDLDLEHCNKAFKEDAHSYRGVFTEKTVSRVSHSALYLSDIAKQIDKTSRVFQQSGKHTEVDTSEDILLLVRQFQVANIFDSVPGRHHQAYPHFDCNPFSGMNMDKFQEWISESLKKFSKKHFYKM